jgi:hypothetical protein
MFGPYSSNSRIVSKAAEPELQLGPSPFGSLPQDVVLLIADELHSRADLVNCACTVSDGELHGAFSAY